MVASRNPIKTYMKKRIIIFCFAIAAIFFAIKLKNNFLSNDIMGDTDMHQSYLKLVPQEREITQNQAFHPALSYTVGDVKFDVPRNDTVMTYKVRNIYRSFKFKNNAHLLVFKDSIPFNLSRQLALIKSTDYSLIKNFADQNKLTSNFDLLLYTYRKVPDDVSFFNLSTKNTIIQYSFLKLKNNSLGVGCDTGFYFFNLNHVRGFQFGKPGYTKKTIISLYTKNDESYTIYSYGLKQDELDFVVNSIEDHSSN